MVGARGGVRGPSVSPCSVTVAMNPMRNGAAFFACFFAALATAFAAERDLADAASCAAHSAALSLVSSRRTACVQTVPGSNLVSSMSTLVKCSSRIYQISILSAVRVFMTTVLSSSTPRRIGLCVGETPG